MNPPKLSQSMKSANNSHSSRRESAKNNLNSITTVSSWTDHKESTKKNPQKRLKSNQSKNMSKITIMALNKTSNLTYNEPVLWLIHSIERYFADCVLRYLFCYFLFSMEYSIESIKIIDFVRKAPKIIKALFLIFKSGFWAFYIPWILYLKSFAKSIKVMGFNNVLTVLLGGVVLTVAFVYFIFIRKPSRPSHM